MNDIVPIISKERIPYHPAIQERYGIDRGSWRALTDAVFPAAQSIEGVILALSYCKSRNLDPFKRPVHIVPIWNKEQRKYIESVWPGIGELRTTAFRTGDYAGADPAEYGPDIQRTFRGDNTEITLTFPEWCQITVYRMVRGESRPWPGPRVYWLETYARQGRTELPNEMWQKRSRGQLEKCAEAAALRKAFPEEIGEAYIGDEIGSDMQDVTPARSAEQQTPAPSSPLSPQIRRAGPPTPREPMPEPEAAVPVTTPGRPSPARATSGYDIGDRAEPAPEQQEETGKRRGRPPGSKNKPKDERPTHLDQEVGVVVSDGPPADFDDRVELNMPDVSDEMMQRGLRRLDEAHGRDNQDPPHNPETGEIEDGNLGEFEEHKHDDDCQTFELRNPLDYQPVGSFEPDEFLERVNSLAEHAPSMDYASKLRTYTSRALTDIRNLPGFEDAVDKFRLKLNNRINDLRGAPR